MGSWHHLPRTGLATQTCYAAYRYICCFALLTEVHVDTAPACVIFAWLMSYLQRACLHWGPTIFHCPRVEASILCPGSRRKTESLLFFESLATLQYTKTAVAKDTLLGFKVFWDLTFPHTATFIPLLPVTWFCRTHRTVPYLPKFSKVRNWPFMCRVVLALKIKFKSSVPSPPPQDCQSSLTKWRSIFQVTRYGSEGCHWKIHVFI